MCFALLARTPFHGAVHAFGRPRGCMGPISLGCTCRTRSTQADESANYARGGLAVSRSYPCLLWSTQYCCGALHRVADKLPIRWEGALFGTNVAEFLETRN